MKELKTASLSEIPERLEILLTSENGYSRKTKNILVRYARWSLTYNKIMMKSDTKYINFEYNVIGVYPYIYLIPTIKVYKLDRIIGNNLIYSVIDTIKDPKVCFDIPALIELGEKHGVEFRQYRGKGPNKKPMARVMLRKFTDIESSYFYLEDYISTDDIIIETFDGLKSSEQRDVFLELGTPCFCMTLNSETKEWIFSLNPTIGSFPEDINFQGYPDDWSEKGIIQRYQEFSEDLQKPRQKVTPESVAEEKRLELERRKKIKEQKRTKNRNNDRSKKICNVSGK